MLNITVDNSGTRAINTALAALSGKSLHIAVQRAAKRAATHAKTVGSKKVRKVYTVKASAIRTAGKIEQLPNGAMLTIFGARMPVDKNYQAKRKKQGVFVAVEKGRGKIVGKSFEWKDHFFKRTYRSRLPIERIIGPAVPQLFENAGVQNEVQTAAMGKYEERLRHEVGRILEGAT